MIRRNPSCEPCGEPKFSTACKTYLQSTLSTFQHSLSLVVISDAIPSADQVRITPSLRSQRGSVWTKNKVNFENWEAEVTFRVSGRGRMGADGLVSSFNSLQTYSVGRLW